MTRDWKWLFASKNMSLYEIRIADTKRASPISKPRKSAPILSPTLKERLKEIDWDSSNQVTEWEDCRVLMTDWRNCFICPFKDCINDKPNITWQMKTDEEEFIETLLFPLNRSEIKIRFYRKKYAYEHREEKKQYLKEWLSTNQDRYLQTQKKLRERTKETKAEYDRLYRENNREKRQKKKKEYYEKNKAKILEKQKQYKTEKKNKRPAPTAPVKE